MFSSAIVALDTVDTGPGMGSTVARVDEASPRGAASAILALAKLADLACWRALAYKVGAGLGGLVRSIRSTGAASRRETKESGIGERVRLLERPTARRASVLVLDEPEFAIPASDTPIAVSGGKNSLRQTNVATMSDRS